MDSSFSSASAAPPVLDFDLNLDLLPKLEPKPEPVDCYDLQLFRQQPPDDVEVDESKPLQHLSPSPNDEDILFAEYFRLAHLFLSLTSAPPPDSSKSIVPVPSAAELVPAQRPRRHHPKRSAEMVRISALSPADQRHFRDLVRRARSTFESLRLLLTCREPPPGSVRRHRPDLRSAAMMTARGLWLNRDRRIIGSIPGIVVGDVFFFRIELCVVGLHGQVQGGIDYVPASRVPTREPIATSIVVSGGYEDDEDSGEVIVYTGHGGRDHNLHRHSVDQKLEGGNLALERSMYYGVEIRVIRGFRFDAGKVYVYDGLYRVVDFWKDVGKSGFAVYKYRIVRIAGQFPMGTSTLRLAEHVKDLLLRKDSLPSGYVAGDLSLGRERLPVAVFNDLDDDREPMLFDYAARPIHPRFPLPPGEGGGCDCIADCAENRCPCAARNGGEFAYDARGVLLAGRPLIYECGGLCSCAASCRNRVSQKGIRARLEVFRSRETGWGVRSLDMIRAGTFVCEYSGVVLTEQQAELLSVDDGGCGLVHPRRFPNRWFEWGDVSAVDPDHRRAAGPPPPQVGFALDVSRTRNVACYLSHSCSPNLFLQLVLHDHYDSSCPHLMIFALENIPPYRELSIDYGVGDGWMVNVST